MTIVVSINIVPFQRKFFISNAVRVLQVESLDLKSEILFMR